MSLRRRRREKTSFVYRRLSTRASLCFPEREEEEKKTMTTTQSSPPPLQRGGGGGGTTTPKEEETTTTSLLKQDHNRHRRTLVIKSFKTAPKIPPRFLDRAWSERLRVALRAIHDQEPCEESHERIYRLVEDLVVGNFGAALYEKVKRAIEDRYVCFWVVPFSY
jgi:hypothetical protein